MRTVRGLAIVAAVIACALLLGLIARAQESPTSLPAATAMPSEELAQLDQRELGPRYAAADAEKYAAAHALIERYFSQPAMRSQTIQSLSALNLDANDLGRLVRIRTNWPALEAGVYYVNERVGPNPTRYFLGIPSGYTRDRSWPLVIELPTADAFVTQPPPDGVGVTRIYQSWMSQEMQRHSDAVLLMPLLNLDELWGPSYAGMNSVLTPMHDAVERANIDPAQVYMLGHSMAAHAAWNLALHEPTYFASFCALAGSAAEDWQRVRIMNLRNTFPVIWHDSDDAVVPVSQAKALQSLLQHFAVPFDLKLTTKVGHVPAAAIVEDRYALMRNHTRELYPKNVSLRSTRLDAAFTRVDWIKIDQPANAGTPQRLLPLHGNGPMTMYQNPFTLEATCSQNQINLIATNVELLRVYLNDQLIDFSMPVTIVLNRRKVFEGVVQPSVEAMMKDQLVLGRGWRYFTAAIDLSTVPATQPTTTPR